MVPSSGGGTKLIRTLRAGEGVGIGNAVGENGAVGEAVGAAMGVGDAVALGSGVGDATGVGDSCANTGVSADNKKSAAILPVIPSETERSGVQSRNLSLFRICSPTIKRCLNCARHDRISQR